MENNQPEKLDKKLFIKKALVNITIAMVFCFSPTFMTYGRMSVKPFLIILGFCIVLGSTMAFFAAKYDNRIIQTKRTRPKFWKISLIFGILIVIAYLWLIIREGGKTNYYSTILLGLYFIYYSFSGSPKIKELESVNTSPPKHSIDGRKWLRIMIGLMIVLAVGIVFLKPSIFIEPEKMPTDKSAEYSQEIYRNLKYHFSIKFPESWEIKEEIDDGTFFIKEATFQDNTIRVSARLVNVGELQEFSSIKDTRPLKEYVDAFFEATKENIPNAKIINYGEVEINNQPAYWMESSMASQAILTYFFAKGDIMYSIGAGTAADEYSKLKPLFMQTISTFVFGNY